MGIICNESIPKIYVSDYIGQIFNFIHFRNTTTHGNINKNGILSCVKRMFIRPFQRSLRKISRNRSLSRITNSNQPINSVGLASVEQVNTSTVKPEIFCISDNTGLPRYDNLVPYSGSCQLPTYNEVQKRISS